MTKLTFDALRKANTLRLAQFKNAHGDLAHSEPDGSDWTPADWLQAVVGELGEYANFRKKFQRGDITLQTFETHARKELADVQTYLDILARRCLDVPGKAHPTGVDLGGATIDKFNEVSRRVKASVWLGGSKGDGVIVSESERQREIDSYHSTPGTVHPCYD